jgi:hypothetical protein
VPTKYEIRLVAAISDAFDEKQTPCEMNDKWKLLCSVACPLTPVGLFLRSSMATDTGTSDSNALRMLLSEEQYANIRNATRTMRNMEAYIHKLFSRIKWSDAGMTWLVVGATPNYLHELKTQLKATILLSDAFAAGVTGDSVSELAALAWHMRILRQTAVGVPYGDILNSVAEVTGTGSRNGSMVCTVFSNKLVRVCCYLAQAVSHLIPCEAWRVSIPDLSPAPAMSDTLLLFLRCPPVTPSTWRTDSGVGYHPVFIEGFMCMWKRQCTVYSSMLDVSVLRELYFEEKLHALSILPSTKTERELVSLLGRLYAVQLMEEVLQALSTPLSFNSVNTASQTVYRKFIETCAQSTSTTAVLVRQSMSLFEYPQVMDTGDACDGDVLVPLADEFIEKLRSLVVDVAVHTATMNYNDMVRAVLGDHNSS